jgi:hypothetical protein
MGATVIQTGSESHELMTVLAEHAERL